MADYKDLDIDCGSESKDGEMVCSAVDKKGRRGKVFLRATETGEYALVGEKGNAEINQVLKEYMSKGSRIKLKEDTGGF